MTGSKILPGNGKMRKSHWREWSVATNGKPSIPYQSRWFTENDKFVFIIRGTLERMRALHLEALHAKWKKVGTTLRDSSAVLLCLRVPVQWARCQTKATYVIIVTYILKLVALNSDRGSTSASFSRRLGKKNHRYGLCSNARTLYLLILWLRLKELIIKIVMA